MNTPYLIRTPDQRLRVFVSSTLRELADEREAVKEAITQLRLAPVMFELGARPHPAINLYRAYLDQSHIFIGIYWQSYGYVAPGMEISGLEDEYLLAGDKPKLIYIKSPAAEREAGLNKLLSRIKNDEHVSYKYFSNADELRQLVENDLSVLLTERFEVSELKMGELPRQHEQAQHNLPAQVSSFIGRDAEISAVKELLRQPGVRLITLTGPGGTGKTRLSQEVAAKLIDQYRDGIIFISLAEAREPGLVVSKVAELLGVREGGSQSLLENVKSYLRDKQMLILMDNFEQVLEAAPLVSGLLESAPELKIMVTSRRRLNLRGEHEVQVPTLQLPGKDEEINEQTTAGCEAIRMFTERAKAANPHFAINDQNVRVVAEICRRVDGLPLAIELAAARVKMLPLDKLLSLLDSRLKLLTGGSQDLPERQQTLRNALEWSIQLLKQEEQMIFARLGVFIGGFNLEAAVEVCDLEGRGEEHILTGLETLVNNSLIQVDTTDNTQLRFKILETIREYAQEKLSDCGELKTVQQRQAFYFRDKMNWINPLFATREADKGLAWFDIEHDNLRAALSYSLADATLTDQAAWLIIAMNWPWYRRGFLSEGRRWGNRLLSASTDQEHTLTLCYALWSSGAMAMWQGDLNPALSLLEAAVNSAKALESPMAVAVTQLFLGTTQVNRGKDEMALTHLHEAAELYEQLAMPWYYSITLVHMGNACLGMGDLSKARAYLDQALGISKQIGENWLLSFILNNYGEAARVEGRYAEARDYYKQSEVLLREMGDKGDLARLVHNLGSAARQLGDFGEAEERLRESLAMFIKLGNQRGIAECMASMAGLWAERGNVLPAVELLSAAHEQFNATGAAWWPADRAEVERLLQTLQQCVEPALFTEAWARGKSLDLQGAIKLAYSSLKPKEEHQ